MAVNTADEWIRQLQLSKHIEGGWYSEVYKSAVTVENEIMPGVFYGDRSVCTHIYFLLQQNDFSAFHRIGSDELWHFYEGDKLIVYELDSAGQLTEHKLGKDPANGFFPFCVIKKGNWFGAKVADGGNYSLVGCTVSPGFDFADFELARAEQLVKQYPAHVALIASLCRQ